MCYHFFFLFRGVVDLVLSQTLVVQRPTNELILLTDCDAPPPSRVPSVRSHVHLGPLVLTALRSARAVTAVCATTSAASASARRATLERGTSFGVKQPQRINTGWTFIDHRVLLFQAKLLKCKHFLPLVANCGTNYFSPHEKLHKCPSLVSFTTILFWHFIYWSSVCSKCSFIF